MDSNPIFPLPDTPAKKRQKRKKLPHELHGVITIEMSYILPLLLSVVVLIMHTVFYFHDKNILIGAAAETAVLGAQLERKMDETGQTDLNVFCRKRIDGKMILFGDASVVTDITEKQVAVSITAGNGRMALRIRQQAPILKPEEKIRMKEVIENGTSNAGRTGSGTE